MTTNQYGWGEFLVNGGSVSIWVQDPIVPGLVDVHFNCNSGTTFSGQNVYVVGSIPELGSWDPAGAIQSFPGNYPTWDGAIEDLPSDTFFEWKCIKKFGGQVEWQGGANNTFTTPLTGTTTFSGSF